MARKSGIEVTGRVIGTPNRELIFNIYRKYGVPQPSYLREEEEKLEEVHVESGHIHSANRES